MPLKRAFTLSRLQVSEPPNAWAMVSGLGHLNHSFLFGNCHKRTELTEGLDEDRAVPVG